MVKKETRDGVLIAVMFFSVALVALTESNTFAAAGWGAGGGAVLGYTYIMETGSAFDEYFSEDSGS